jgi:hypothetical protein
MIGKRHLIDKVDGASGNSNSPGRPFGTFNPLFPNGYYLTLAGYQDSSTSSTSSRR